MTDHATTTSKREVMLVDAEQPFADGLIRALDENGYSGRLLSAGDVIDTALRESPDVVVVCVELPGASGYALCNRLKKHAALSHVPIILTSQEQTPEAFAQHRKLATRADGYLIKPFAADALIAAIGDVLAGSERAAEQRRAAAEARKRALQARADRCEEVLHWVAAQVEITGDGLAIRGSLELAGQLNVSVEYDSGATRIEAAVPTGMPGFRLERATGLSGSWRRMRGGRIGDARLDRVYVMSGAKPARPLVLALADRLSEVSRWGRSFELEGDVWRAELTGLGDQDAPQAIDALLHSWRAMIVDWIERGGAST
jgi:DNA-binding response OmpR family regulator